MVETNADGEQMKSRLPPPSMELPTTGSVKIPSAILQNPSKFGSNSEGKPDMPALSRTVSPRRFAILRALGKEMSEERKEAQTEAQQGWEKGEQKEQKRLREMLKLREAEQNGGAEEVQGDAQSTHSSQRRTLRFI